MKLSDSFEYGSQIVQLLNCKTSFLDSFLPTSAQRIQLKTLSGQKSVSQCPVWRGSVMWFLC